MNESLSHLPANELYEYLETLGLSPELLSKYSIADIKRAYKNKAKIVHPDQGGSQEDFEKLHHAYKMMVEPQYRNKQLNSRKPNGLDITIRVPCSFESAFFGTILNISLSVLKVTQEGILDLEQAEKDGITEVEQKVFTIHVPPGSVAGYKHTKTGFGIQCGSHKGNAIVEVMVNPHPNAQVRIKQGMYGEPRDVVCPILVPLYTMLKGGEYEVITMYGIKTIEIPPGTMPNQQIVIPKCGVKTDTYCGDHICIVQPIYPSKEDLKQPHWNGLGIEW